jgi:hypothetical protein
MNRDSNMPVWKKTREKKKMLIGSMDEAIIFN